MRAPWLPCIVLCGAVGVCAQPRALALREFVATAVRESPDLAAARARLMSVGAAHAISRSAALPGVTARAFGSLDGALPSQPSDPSGAYGWSVSVQQAINTAGREAIAVRAGRHSRDAAVQDTAAIRQAVVLEATAAYYRYALALRVVEVEQEALVKAEQYLAFAEASVAAGKQAKYAQTRAAVSAAEARLSLLDAHNAARSARLELDIAAGVSLGDSVVLTDSLETAPEAAALERALVSARDNNPSYAAARAREESARLLLRSARAAFAPRVTASAQVGQSAANGGDFDADWGADLGVSVPLFAGGALRAAVEQARASHAQAVAGLRAAEQQLQADVERAVLAQQAAVQAVEAAAALVAQSREGLELAEERNRAGVGIPLEIADARAAYAAAAMKHAQTLFALQLAHASLLMAMGQLGG